MSRSQTRYHRILVVANQTCPCPGLARRASDMLERPDGELLLVAPALTKHGVNATSQVGDADPFIAMRDALHDFAAEAVIISTYPVGQSHWQERGPIERVRLELDVPILHLESHFGLPVAA